MTEEDPIHIKNLEAWYEADKKEPLRFNYPLNRESIIFDLGAYTGDWAIEMWKRYQCVICGFEPVNDIFKELDLKTKKYEMICLYKYAVSNKNEQRLIYKDKDGSGFYIPNNTNTELVEVKSIVDIIKNEKIDHIDLMKFNVEAEEYNILECMIENDLLKIVDHFQIQFHRDVDNYNNRRKFIQSELNKTHNQIYNFDYIWESWSRK